MLIKIRFPNCFTVLISFVLTRRIINELEKDLFNTFYVFSFNRSVSRGKIQLGRIRTIVPSVSQKLVPGPTGTDHVQKLSTWDRDFAISCDFCRGLWRYPMCRFLTYHFAFFYSLVVDLISSKLCSCVLCDVNSRFGFLSSCPCDYQCKFHC